MFVGSGCSRIHYIQLVFFPLFFVEFCDVPTLAIEQTSTRGELAKCDWLHVKRGK
jgi:hypothetical protein